MIQRQLYFVIKKKLLKGKAVLLYDGGVTDLIARIQVYEKSGADADT